jgi:transcriptional regulator with GAF, ATPase, and Fis domain
MSSIMGTIPNHSNSVANLETQKPRMPEAQLFASPMEIIGESPSLKRVLQQVESVAATDSAVLMLGETGKGKNWSPEPSTS